MKISIFEYKRYLQGHSHFLKVTLRCIVISTGAEKQQNGLDSLRNGWCLRRWGHINHGLQRFEAKDAVRMLEVGVGRKQELTSIPTRQTIAELQTPLSNFGAPTSVYITITSHLNHYNRLPSSLSASTLSPYHKPYHHTNRIMLLPCLKTFEGFSLQPEKRYKFFTQCVRLCVRICPTSIATSPSTQVLLMQHMDS